MNYQLTVLLLFVASTFFAQDKNETFEKGTVYFTSGETKTGWLNKTPTMKLSAAVQFKATPDAAIKEYSPKEVSAFVFDETKEKYKSEAIHYYKRTTQSRETRFEGHKFGRVLLEGEVSLSKVYLKRGEYNGAALDMPNYLYVFQEKGREAVQIDRLKVNQSQNNQIASKRYQGVLGYIVRDCPKIVAKAESTRFKDKYILNLLEAYQNCKGYTSTETYKPEKLVVLKHFVVGGIGSIIDKGLKSPFLLDVGYELKLKFPRTSKRLGFTIGTDYIFQNYTWTFFEQSVSDHFFRLPIQFDYTLMEQKETTVNAHVGFAIYLLQASSLDVPSVVRNFQNLSTGISFESDLWKFQMNYETQFSNFWSPNQVIRLLAGYKFR